MATIKTSIMVHDGMSGALRHMNGALQATVSAFEQMQSATNQSINTKQFDTVKKDLAVATQQMDRYEQAVNDTVGDQQRLNNEINNGASAFKRIAGAVGAAFATYLSFQKLQALVSASDEYANTIARISMMNDGLQTTAELQKLIYQSAQNSYSAYADTASMVAKLGNNAASAFKSSKEIVEFAELVQKQFSIAGTGAIEASNAILQLTQALASGVLRGDELNSIFEQAPNLIQNVAKHLDVPIGQIRDMASNGEITAQIVKDAMFAAADDINKKFNSMPLTFAKIWTTITNYFENQMASVHRRLNDAFNSEQMAFFQQAAMGAIDVVVFGINLIIMALITLGTWVATVGQFFMDNWTWIAPILMTIAIILGSIVTILLVKYTILGLLRAASLAWAAAQWVVNAAYLASPITWVLIGIIVVIALIVYALVVWGEQTATVIGFVAGLFAALGAFIGNIIINIANLLTIFAEFFINIFIDPVYAVKKLFYDLTMMVADNMGAMAGSFDQAANVLADVFVKGANIAIGAINGLISALNMIPGVEIGKIGKLATGGGNFLSKAWKSQVANIKAPTSDKNVVSLQKTSLINIPDAFNSGFDWGYKNTLVVSDALNGLVDKAKDFVNYDLGSSANQMSPLADLLNGTGMGGTDYLDALNDINDAIKDGKGAADKTAKNTGKIADKANLTKDDIAYLREQVAGNLQNIFKKLNIKVDMKNENYINNEMDIDGVIDRFGERVEETVLNLAEGGGVDV